MAAGDTYVFPGFLTPVLTQLLFPKPLTTFLTCFCRGERRKYVGKKSRLNQGSNSQPPGHEFDTLTTEPPGRVFSLTKGRQTKEGEIKTCVCLHSPNILHSVLESVQILSRPTWSHPSQSASVTTLVAEVSLYHLINDK